MFDLENLNYSVENENVIGFLKGGRSTEKWKSLWFHPLLKQLCTSTFAEMDDGKKPANSAAAWPEGFCLKSFLGSSWRKSLIKNFRWLLPFLFVNKEASEEVSEVFTQKRKWSAQGKTQICYLSFNVLKEHKDVVKENLSVFSLLSETFLDRPVRQLSCPWMGVWLECWLTDSPILTKRNSKTSVICKSGYVLHPTKEGQLPRDPIFFGQTPHP